MPDFGCMRNHHFIALANNRPLPPLHDPAAPSAAALAIEDVDPLQEADVSILPPTPAAVAGFDAALVAMVAHPPTLEIRPKVRDDGLRVYFDNFTHGSGRRRAFCSCRYPGHGRCNKYVWLNEYDSPSHAAAWLFAWEALAPASPGHVDHLASEPSVDAVRLYLDELGDG